MYQDSQFEAMKAVSDQSIDKDEKKSANHTKNVMYKIIFIGLVIVFIISTTYAYFAIGKRINRKSSHPGAISSLDTIDETSENIETVNLSEIPLLPNQFKWSKTVIDASGDQYNQVYLIKEPDIFYQPVNLPGTLWITNLKNMQNSNFDPGKDLFEYYSAALTNLRWTSDLNTDAYRLVAIAADGGLGSSTGYLGVNSDQLRVVNMGYLVTSFDKLTLTRDAEYWVFVSDSVSIVDIIKQAEDKGKVNSFGNQQTAK